ncbi:MAG: hypothetical protein Q7J58_21700, partial [Hydrogenophaga sp.]|nr:hypothetical protein [Hydrogenophaga sp.]
SPSTRVCASIDARAWSSRGTCSARLPDFGRRYACRALAQGLLLHPIGHTIYAILSTMPWCDSSGHATSKSTIASMHRLRSYSSNARIARSLTARHEASGAKASSSVSAEVLSARA